MAESCVKSLNLIWGVASLRKTVTVATDQFRRPPRMLPKNDAHNSSSSIENVVKSDFISDSSAKYTAPTVED